MIQILHPLFTNHCPINKGAPLVALLCVLALTAACSSSNDPVTSPAATGEKLTGTVTAFACSSAQTISPEGIRVTLQGSKFSATTDTGGHFQMDNIPAGVYNIVFSKPGFDSMIYPVHHLIGVGNDIINDAFLIQESNDSVAIRGISSVFTVSVLKHVTIIDTLFVNNGGKIDTIPLQRDSIAISYDTVSTANALIVTSKFFGSMPPANVFVYSSLDSTLYPSSPSPQTPSMSEDAWLSTKLGDTAYKYVCQSPRIASQVFNDTLSRDAKTLQPYSLPAGQPVYIYIVGHSNTYGVPSSSGEYQHYYTTPYGPAVLRYKFIVP